MARPVEIGRDIEAVRKAAAEFFVEGYEFEGANQRIQATPVHLREAARRSLLNFRSLPEGAYRWIVYLLWLERILEVTTVPLFAIEVEGLQALKRERDRFQAAHPACPHCGMPNDPHTFHCRECLGEIKKK